HLLLVVSGSQRETTQRLLLASSASHSKNSPSCAGWAKKSVSRRWVVSRWLPLTTSSRWWAKRSRKSSRRGGNFSGIAAKSFWEIASAVAGPKPGSFANTPLAQDFRANIFTRVLEPACLRETYVS